MTVSVSKKADFSVAEFDGELSIFNVAESHAVLSKAVSAQPKKFIADLTALQDFDSAGLQLLFWLKTHLDPKCEFTLTCGENDVVLRVFGLYGLDMHLQPVVTELQE